MTPEQRKVYNKRYRDKNIVKLKLNAKEKRIKVREHLNQINKEWKFNNKDKVKAYNKVYKDKYKEQLAKKSSEYYKKERESNPEKNKIKCKSLYNKFKEKRLSALKIYRKQNRYKLNAIGSRHRAQKLERTPNWLTKEHLEQIKLFFKKAKELQRGDGIPRHVDHIVPLKGKNVSGLHVPWNLQILTQHENVTKNNKF